MSGSSSRSSESSVSQEPKLYPNCDFSLWLRSATEEKEKPTEGTVSFGEIPAWLNGDLIRNGPGGPNVYGEGQCKHLFDGPGLLHKFTVSNQRAYYKNRYIRSKSYTRNLTARRLILSEFGTFTTLDPCYKIFHRVTTLFTGRIDRIMTDTANISIQPFGDEVYTLAETPFAHRIDPDTLRTASTINVHNDLGIIHHTSHPHIDTQNHRVFNLGLRISPWLGPHYIIVEMSTKNEETPPTVTSESKDWNNSPWSSAKILCKIPCRWSTTSCYMHSFTITENYFVIIEQPLGISLLSIPYNFVWAEKPIASSLQFYPEEETIFQVIKRRKNGQRSSMSSCQSCTNDGSGDEEELDRQTFHAPSFFFLHTINGFEVRENGNDYIVIDICTYKDSKMLECMYVEALKNAQSNPDYATLFRGRPRRYWLKLNDSTISSTSSIVGSSTSNHGGSTSTSSTSTTTPQTAESSLIVDIGCETPQINYGSYNGRPYEYFYGISSDVDLEHPGTLIKVNATRKTYKTWNYPNSYPSEPIFQPNPSAKREDDGIILSTLLYGGESIHGPNRVSLVILDASEWCLLAKVDFDPGAVIPKCLHGWFFPKTSSSTLLEMDVFKGSKEEEGESSNNPYDNK